MEVKMRSSTSRVSVSMSCRKQIKNSTDEGDDSDKGDLEATDAEETDKEQYELS